MLFIFPGLNRNDGCIFWGGELSQVKTIICNCFRQCAFPSIVSENAQQSWETDLARGAAPTPDSARGSPPRELFFPIPLSPSPLMTVPRLVCGVTFIASSNCLFSFLLEFKWFRPAPSTGLPTVGNLYIFAGLMEVKQRTVRWHCRDHRVSAEKRLELKSPPF